MDIDTTLARTPDGGLALKAAAGEIRFSGGGSDTRLAHLEKGGRDGVRLADDPARTERVRRDRDLPNVFAGADLQVTATPRASSTS